MKKKQLIFDISLDDESNPKHIELSGDDISESGESIPAKAFFITLLEQEKKDTLKLSLWTDQMQVMEMDRFIYYSIRSLTDMYHRATKNSELANEMQKFAQYFAEKTEIIPPQE